MTIEVKAEFVFAKLTDSIQESLLESSVGKLPVRFIQIHLERLEVVSKTLADR